MSDYLFGRRASLIVAAKGKVLDLSEFRFTFKIVAADEESPTNAAIRVYNLAPTTIASIRKEFMGVVVQAGYGDNYGVIFDGQIKTFRVGRENQTDTYFDILASDGDLAYNFAVCNQTLAAGSTPKDRILAISKSMEDKGALPPDDVPNTGGILPRGKVLFGMARAMMRNEVANQKSTWSFDGGKLKIFPLDSYGSSTIVDLTSQTGLVGRVEVTQDGIKARCLLNPRIAVGGLVRIDNSSINQILNQDQNAVGIAPYDQWAGVQLYADVAGNGLYRVFVIEYEGDTRGTPFYCSLTLLAVDPATKKVIGDQ